MKNKKGFTLVELLAVIAILTILVIIAIPNVLKLFNTGRKSIFTTEVKNLYKTAQHQWMQDSLVTSTERVYTKCDGCGTDKELPISGGKNLSYYIKLNQIGEVIEMYVTNGSYQFEYSGNLLETYMNNAEIVGDLEDSEIISIVPEGVKKNNAIVNGDAPVLSGLTEQEKESLSLTLTYDWPATPTTTTSLTIVLNNSSNMQSLNSVRYVVKKAQQNSYNHDDWGEYYDLSPVISTNKANNFTETIDTGHDNWGFKFIVDVYVNEEKILTKDLVRYWCFVAGTKVLTESGYKNIEDIKVGEKVYSYNMDRNAVELKEVKRTITSSAIETLKMTIGSETVEMTDLHELYIVDKGWTRAYNVKVGDKMLDSDSNIITITKIERIIYDEPITTYNLSVDGNNNYFVTNNKVLVHNSPE